jgi:DNA-binding MarR family transcriptional regulator
VTRHPIHNLNDDVHQRVRLGILASLDGLAKTDFNHLKTTLELTDGNLGRHLQALEEAGLVSQTRTTGDGRPRTWIKITSKGRRALRDEIQALQQLLGELGPNATMTAPNTDPQAPSAQSGTTTPRSHSG